MHDKTLHFLNGIICISTDDIDKSALIIVSINDKLTYWPKSQPDSQFCYKQYL